MFQISDSDSDAYEDDRTGPLPLQSGGGRGEGSEPSEKTAGLKKHSRTAPNLQNPGPHQSHPPSHTDNMEILGRPSSESQISDSESLDELGPFRTRSRSAPPNFWAARKYGQELRRMSDEFDMSFLGLPRPKSAGAAGEMVDESWWKKLIRSLKGRGQPRDPPGQQGVSIRGPD
ncbi:BCL2 associated agonist of cell death b [Latimeria chalumnae]|uniref:BCL2 associated agonist of cell death n=1 Tax=Latimeria chalumnae TaxID=7897 RepID=H3ANP3_LATCH|nr:PREDICTED: bcl2-associated agonist of cell death [Latimeria chalumnae]|eukprot:XP_006007097.1 PREDICTED: bcl2-associated agonist of cell death [Latimeria chalumnae]